MFSYGLDHTRDVQMYLLRCGIKGQTFLHLTNKERNNTLKTLMQIYSLYDKKIYVIIYWYLNGIRQNSILLLNTIGWSNSALLLFALSYLSRAEHGAAQTIITIIHNTVCHVTFSPIN